MANTPLHRVRAEPDLLDAAYGAHPELKGLNTATLLRVGLLVLAGHQVEDAVPLALRKRGPKQPAAA
jgi:hypothetical protein